MTNTLYENYIPNLIDAMMTDLEISDKYFMMFRHYNTLDLSAEYVESFAKKRENVRFLYHSFNAENMQNAYEPFLDWIRDLYQEATGKTLEQFFDACNVYQLHRPVFKSYFETGICMRNEELLISDLEYEQSRFMDEIVRMLCEISKSRPIIMILNRIHAAGASTVRALLNILSDKYDKRIGVLATYNEVAPELSYIKKDWERLLNRFEENNCVLEWALDTKPIKTDSLAGFKFNISDIEKYCEKLNNMYCFLAFDQAEYYLDTIYYKFEVEKVYLKDKCKCIFLELYASINMYQDRTSSMMLYCNGIKEIVARHDNLDWKYRYYYLATKIYMYSYQHKQASTYADKCEKIAVKLGDEYKIFRIKMLKHMIVFQGWRNTWILGASNVDDKELIREAGKYNYLNHLAHIYVYSYDNVEEKYRDISKLDQTLEYFNKGIEIAKKIGNDNFLIEAYKKNVMIASTNGYYDVANYFYERCYEIVANNNDLSEEAVIYNGMGYNCCTMEKYVKANEYFNKALANFYKIGDIDSVNETIYNMAVNAILAGDYSTAEKYLTECLKIIKIMKVNSVRVCNISKIYGLRAYCTFNLGEIYNSSIDIQCIERFLGHLIKLEDNDESDFHLWDDDLFLYYFIGGLMDEDAGKLHEAYEKMDKATKYVERSKGSEFFNLIPYSVAYARICRKLGRKEQADRILEECIRFCDDRGYIYKRSIVKDELEGKKHAMIKLNMPLKGMTLEEINEQAIKLGMEKHYNEQKTEINFLSIWQKLINANGESMERTIDNALLNFKNRYNIDELTFIRIENDKPVIRYNDSRYDFNDEKIKYLLDYFTENNTEFAITRLDKGYEEHRKMIDTIFGFNAINTLICIPIFINEKLSGLFICCVLLDMDWNYKNKRFLFDENDLAILMMMFRQLMDSIDRMETQIKIEMINNELQAVNKRLKEIAVKDNLTGLYNREGLNVQMEQKIKKSCREGKSLKLSLIYADLDNFKYYNDTFGHDIGDLVLKGFSEIISDICRDIGYAVRYGGDEFIIIIFSNDREQIEKIVKDIYIKLEEKNGFVEHISNELGRKVEIPAEHVISCSVGISDTVISSKDDIKNKMEETLKRADTMMYYVKKTTKNKYVFFGDIK